jgi:pilus assembly protein CpaE
MAADTQYLIKLAFNTLNLTKKFSQIINSTGGFPLLASDDPRKPDLLIVEVGKAAEKDMAHVQALLNTGEANEIFLTSDHADPALLMQAMRIGVKEFFSQPIREDEVRQALERFKTRHQEPARQLAQKKGRIFTVFGSKGGVGTTTVAVNIAVSLVQNDADCSVALLDMNTLFGEIPMFLEMSPKFHWGEITKNIERLDNTFLSNILASHPSGIKLLPSPAYLNGHVRPTPAIMTRLLSLMKQMFDYIIVDGGQSTDDTSLKVLEISDTLLLITILSLPCLANTNKLLKSFTDLGYVRSENIKVVLNRRMKKGEISLKDAETGIGKELYWTIPNDFETTVEAINNGKPLLDIAPKARVTKNIFDLANSLSVPKEEKQKKKWSLFKR